MVGQKHPLQPRHVRAIRDRLDIVQRTRALALFHLAIDSIAWLRPAASHGWRRSCGRAGQASRCDRSEQDTAAGELRDRAMPAASPRTSISGLSGNPEESRVSGQRGLRLARDCGHLGPCRRIPDPGHGPGRQGSHPEPPDCCCLKTVADVSESAFARSEALFPSIRSSARAMLGEADMAVPPVRNRRSPAGSSPRHGIQGAVFQGCPRQREYPEMSSADKLPFAARQATPVGSETLRRTLSLLFSGRKACSAGAWPEGLRPHFR